jgi:hypothetical protein
VSGSLRLRLALVVLRLLIVLGLTAGFFAVGRDAMKPWLILGGIVFISSWIATILMFRNQKPGANAHG